MAAFAASAAMGSISYKKRFPFVFSSFSQADFLLDKKIEATI
jgi:hypothetical protein